MTGYDDGERRPEWVTEARHEGGRGAVERRCVKRLYAPRKSMDRRRAEVRRDGAVAAAGERFRAGPAGRGRCEMRNLFNLSQFRSHRALRLPAGRALRINFGLGRSRDALRSFAPSARKSVE